jgi:hypothetical protein
MHLNKEQLVIFDYEKQKLMKEKNRKFLSKAEIQNLYHELFLKYVEFDEIKMGFFVKGKKPTEA